MAVTIHVSQCRFFVGATAGVVVLQRSNRRQTLTPKREVAYGLPMASRQCAVTPGLLDIIVSGRMISGGKPLYQSVWSAILAIIVGR